MEAGDSAVADDVGAMTIAGLPPVEARGSVDACTGAALSAFEVGTVGVTVGLSFEGLAAGV